MSPDSASGGGRRYGGASADERRADRRERLIRAAITLYGEQGYRRTTVSAVCRTAGLTPRYFYEAFQNSEALLTATFAEVAAYVMDRVTAAAEGGGSGEGRLVAMLTTYYELLREEPSSSRVFLSEVSGIDDRVDALFAGAMASFADLIARTLDPDHVEGSILPLARAGAMQGLLAVARAWVARDFSEPVTEVIRTAVPLCRMLVDAPTRGCDVLPAVSR